MMFQYSLIKKMRGPAIIIAGLFLVGCDDDPAPQQQPEAPAALRRDKPVSELPWLQVKDKIDPADWLASREDEDSAPEAWKDAARDIRRTLVEADGRFYEGRRMIANRAVQVEAMLRENGIKESARSVIEALSGIAQPGEHAGFGETCQHYVTSRVQGLSRPDALALLKRKGLPAPVESDER